MTALRPDRAASKALLSPKRPKNEGMLCSECPGGCKGYSVEFGQVDQFCADCTCPESYHTKEPAHGLRATSTGDAASVALDNGSEDESARPTKQARRAGVGVSAAGAEREVIDQREVVAALAALREQLEAQVLGDVKDLPPSVEQLRDRVFDRLARLQSAPDNAMLVVGARGAGKSAEINARLGNLPIVPSQGGNDSVTEFVTVLRHARVRRFSLVLRVPTAAMLCRLEPTKHTKEREFVADFDAATVRAQVADLWHATEDKLEGLLQRCSDAAAATEAFGGLAKSADLLAACFASGRGAASVAEADTVLAPLHELASAQRARRARVGDVDGSQSAPMQEDASAPAQEDTSAPRIVEAGTSYEKESAPMQADDARSAQELSSTATDDVASLALTLTRDAAEALEEVELAVIDGSDDADGGQQKKVDDAWAVQELILALGEMLFWTPGLVAFLEVRSAHFPESAFPSDFVLVDTPGLGDLKKSAGVTHARETARAFAKRATWLVVSANTRALGDGYLVPLLQQLLAERATTIGAVGAPAFVHAIMPSRHMSRGEQFEQLAGMTASDLAKFNNGINEKTSANAGVVHSFKLLDDGVQVTDRRSRAEGKEGQSRAALGVPDGADERDVEMFRRVRLFAWRRDLILVAGDLESFKAKLALVCRARAKRELAKRAAAADADAAALSVPLKRLPLWLEGTISGALTGRLRTALMRQVDPLIESVLLGDFGGDESNDGLDRVRREQVARDFGELFESMMRRGVSGLLESSYRDLAARTSRPRRRDGAAAAAGADADADASQRAKSKVTAGGGDGASPVEKLEDRDAVDEDTEDEDDDDDSGSIDSLVTITLTAADEELLTVLNTQFVVDHDRATSVSQGLDEDSGLTLTVAKLCAALKERSKAHANSLQARFAPLAWPSWAKQLRSVAADVVDMLVNMAHARACAAANHLRELTTSSQVHLSAERSEALVRTMKKLCDAPLKMVAALLGEKSKARHYIKRLVTSDINVLPLKPRPERWLTATRLDANPDGRSDEPTKIVSVLHSFTVDSAEEAALAAELGVRSNDGGVAKVDSAADVDADVDDKAKVVSDGDVKKRKLDEVDASAVGSTPPQPSDPAPPRPTIPVLRTMRFTGALRAKHCARVPAEVCKASADAAAAVMANKKRVIEFGVAVPQDATAVLKHYALGLRAAKVREDADVLHVVRSHWKADAQADSDAVEEAAPDGEQLHLWIPPIFLPLDAETCTAQLSKPAKNWLNPLRRMVRGRVQLSDCGVATHLVVYVTTAKDCYAVQEALQSTVGDELNALLLVVPNEATSVAQLHPCAHEFSLLFARDVLSPLVGVYVDACLLPSNFAEFEELHPALMKQPRVSTGFGLHVLQELLSEQRQFCLRGMSDMLHTSVDMCDTLTRQLFQLSQERSAITAMNKGGKPLSGPLRPCVCLEIGNDEDGRALMRTLASFPTPASAFDSQPAALFRSLKEHPKVPVALEVQRFLRDCRADRARFLHEAAKASNSQQVRDEFQKLADRLRDVDGAWSVFRELVGAQLDDALSVIAVRVAHSRSARGNYRTPPHDHLVRVTRTTHAVSPLLLSTLATRYASVLEDNDSESEQLRLTAEKAAQKVRRKGATSLWVRSMDRLQTRLGVKKAGQRHIALTKLLAWCPSRREDPA